KIENPWCLYGIISWWGFSKVVEEQRNILFIKYSEKGEWHAWDSDYVKRFVSLKEAVKEYARHKGWSFAKVKEKALEDFPSENI
ncbi:MAG: hypothetical protein Q8N21_02350, partial [bacterium]|nr:hypothetical protein [bacterium]